MFTDYWYKGKPTSAGARAYSEGDCWILAYAIHEITGLPIVVTGDLDDWDHVLVKVDEHRSLDIFGIRENSTVLRNFGQRTSTITELPFYGDTWAEYVETLCYESCTPPAYFTPKFPGGNRTARAVAKRLVAKHLDTLVPVG